MERVTVIVPPARRVIRDEVGGGGFLCRRSLFATSVVSSAPYVPYAPYAPYAA